MDVTTLTAVFGSLGALGGLSGIVAWARLAAQNRLDRANADHVLVDTAQTLVEALRAEMDRKVTDLEREVGRLRGHLEAATRERDHLRDVERQLREENGHLRQRIEALESRIADLTAQLAAAQGV